MAEKKEEKQNKVEITQVATQTDVAYKLPDGSIVSLPEYLVWLGNLILDINKEVA